MGIIRDQAFILSTYPLKEADLITVFFSEGTGKRRGVARGARGRRSRFGASLNPLTRVEIVYFEKENRELVSIRECALLRSSFPLAVHLACPEILPCIAETWDRFFHEHQASSRGFRLLAHVMDALFHGVPEGIVSVYLSLWVLKIAGVFPNLSVCGKCGQPGRALSPDSLEVFCASCASLDAHVYSAALVEQIELLSTKSLLDVPGDLPGRELRELDALLSRIRRHFLERELKGYRFLMGCDKLFIP